MASKLYLFMFFYLNKIFDLVTEVPKGAYIYELAAI